MVFGTGNFFKKHGSFEKTRNSERGIFKNTEVLKKHGILMKTPSFGLSSGEF